MYPTPGADEYQGSFPYQGGDLQRHAWTKPGQKACTFKKNPAVCAMFVFGLCSDGNIRFV